MKKNISNLTARMAGLLLTAVATLGFTACNEQDMTEVTPAYSAQPEAVQTWTNTVENGAAQNATLTFALTGEGAELDTVCHIVLIDADGTRRFYYNGQCSYDALLGMTTIHFPTSAEGVPARAYLARRNDTSIATLQLLTLARGYNSTDYTEKVLLSTLNMAPSSLTFDFTNSMWMSAVNGEDGVMLNFDQTSEQDGFVAGKVQLLVTDANLEEANGTYTFSRTEATGTITSEAGETIATLAVKNGNRLVLTAAGRDYELTPNTNAY